LLAGGGVRSLLLLLFGVFIELMAVSRVQMVARGYSRMAKSYAQQRGRYSSQKLLEKFSVRLQRKSHVLDLGCGAGIPVDRFLSKKGFRVTGIDLAVGMLALARKNVPRARFIRMDFSKMKFKPNKFDAAVSFYALIHLPREKHEAVYRRLHRVLKPGAVMLVNACGSVAWQGVQEYMGVPMFWSHYGPKRTLRIIQSQGFEINWSSVLSIGGEKQFWVLATNRKP